MSEKDNGGPAFPLHPGAYRDYGMDMRQYAAIRLCVPDSGNEWLDEMILKAKRDEFAAKAMQSLMLRCTDAPASRFCKAAYEMADAMLEARKS